MLHIAGLHGRLDCLRAIHSSLVQLQGLHLQVENDENPYIKADKVRNGSILGAILYYNIHVDIISLFDIAEGPQCSSSHL